MLGMPGVHYSLMRDAGQQPAGCFFVQRATPFRGASRPFWCGEQKFDCTPKVTHWPVEHFRSERMRTAHEKVAAIYAGIPGRGAQAIKGVREHRSACARVEGLERMLYQWRDKQEGTFRNKRPGPVVD